MTLAPHDRPRLGELQGDDRMFQMVYCQSRAPSSSTVVRRGASPYVSGIVISQSYGRGASVPSYDLPNGLRTRLLWPGDFPLLDVRHRRLRQPVLAERLFERLFSSHTYGRRTSGRVDA